METTTKPTTFADIVAAIVSDADDAQRPVSILTTIGMWHDAWAGFSAGDEFLTTWPLESRGEGYPRFLPLSHIVSIGVARQDVA